MSTREYYVQCFQAERPKFVRVLRALPSDQSSYRPHERSSSAADIAWLLASELHDACDLVDRSEVNFVQVPAPSSLNESIEAYEKNAAELEKRLAKLDDAGWEKPARFLMNGAPVWESTLGDMLFGFLFDAIHHRGQLSAYLRPMGGKVPSIYGPSADDAGS
jgi:uncharacterized damage-inducible protein DinB